MTPAQRGLARHALGLPNDRRRSYRNRYFVAAAGDVFDAWQAMVAAGDAADMPITSMRNSVGFELTRQGALAALCQNESLCPEDFPPEPSASAIAEARS